MTKQLNKNSKLFFIFTFILIFLYLNLTNSTNEAISDFNSIQSDIDSEIIPDEITPYCNGESYSELNLLGASDIKNLEINLVDKGGWIENIFSTVEESRDYIFEERKKRFKGEVKVFYKNGVVCNLKSEIRLTGDYQDHIRDPFTTSMDIHLNEGNIQNIVKFKLFLPETRRGDMEFIATTIIEKLGFLTPRTFKVDVSVNGQQKEAYIFQEKLTKELVEYNKFRESAILETSEDFFWENRASLNSNSPVLFGKLLNYNWVVRSPYNNQIAINALNKLNKLIFQSDGSYLTYDYKDNQHLYLFDSAIFALDGHHGLAIHNRKFYFDNINNELLPVYYDIDSQLAERELSVKDCSENLNSSYDRFVCINNFSSGAKEILNNLDFGPEEIIKDLTKKNIVIEDKFVKNIFNKFKKNLQYISSISNIKNNFNDDYLYQFKVNYLSNVKSSNVGFYFINIEENNIELCTIELLNCNYRNFSDETIANTIKYNDIEYYLLGSSKLENKSLNHSDTQVNIIENIFVKSFGTPLLLEKDLSKKIINIELGKNNKILIYGNGTLDGWKFNITGNSDSSIDEFRQDENSLTGCVTIYDISLKNVEIISSNNNCEDAINLLNVDGTISNIEIQNSYFDGLDIDFSNLIINKINIFNSGNDCLDISSSNVEINTFNSQDCSDKSLSIGEKSFIHLEKLQSYNSKVVVAVKDSSSISIIDLLGEENEMCIAMYRKKQEFGPSKLSIRNNFCTAFNDNFIQAGQEYLNEK